MPSSKALPPKTCANSGEAMSPSSRSNRAAVSRDQASSRGAATGVGFTSEYDAARTSRTPGPWCGSPGSSVTKRLSKVSGFIGTGYAPAVEAAQTKTPGQAPAFRTTIQSLLERLDFVGLHTLLALHGDKANALAFLQRLEARTLDRAEMHEKVRAALRGDEAKTLGIVEPLDGTGLTVRHL
jgi:hypothetical protein